MNKKYFAFKLNPSRPDFVKTMKAKKKSSCDNIQISGRTTWTGEK